MQTSDYMSLSSLLPLVCLH